MQHWPLLPAPLRRRSALIPLLLLLAGCGPVVSYADVLQTAQAGGCWPNRPAYPTPPPATITPALPLTPTPLGYRWPAGAPSPTPPPTTTPFPRCPPAPGETLAPWPTAVPPPPPYPTMAEARAGGGSGQKNTLRLPEVVLAVDLATHPTEGWPAVAAAVWSGNDNPERAFVSVYHPATRTWTPAHQVDVGPAGLGRYTRTVEVAVSGDGVVHAVWGMSDPDFRDNDPPAGVWAAASACRLSSALARRATSRPPRRATPAPCGWPGSRAAAPSRCAPSTWPRRCPRWGGSAMQRPLLPLAIALLALLTLACGAAGVLETGGAPRWACPSPTPLPWGTAGPVKEVIRHTRPISEGGDWEETRYYAEWEQEYPEAGGPPFPSPTPYARVGGSYTLGQRVEVGPLHVEVAAAAGPVVTDRTGIPDGSRQLYFIDLTWRNRATVDIPVSYANRVRLRAVRSPGGAVISDASWAYSQTAREIAGGPELPAAIPPGESRVRVPVLAPVGAPETVELIFIGNPEASYPLPTATLDSSAPPPGTPTATPSPTPAGNVLLQDLDPQLITVQWTATTWVPPGGQPCGDPGALTDWGSEPAGTWGKPILVGGPPPPPGADRLLQVALAQVGKPYVWGAKGPNAFDCSGLCSWSYAQIGIGIPGGSRAQFAGMRPVAAGELRPGDLIFFSIAGTERVDHVGLLADVNADGAWDLIHAASPALGVRVDYGVFASAYYQPRIRGFRTAR